MARFLIDAQLPPRLADWLSERGHVAEHVNRIGLGAAGDSAIWQHMIRCRTTLLTKDEDFVALARENPSGPQVVWVRIGNISNHSLWRALDSRLDEIVQLLDAGERIIEVV
jgi:predicted nuclease of predicted toxin-antitoxin system